MIGERIVQIVVDAVRAVKIRLYRVRVSNCVATALGSLPVTMEKESDQRFSGAVYLMLARPVVLSFVRYSESQTFTRPPCSVMRSFRCQVASPPQWVKGPTNG